MTRHMLSGKNDLYTPLTTEIVELLEDMHRLYGTWAMVGFHVGVKLRCLRRWRDPKSGYKSISMTVLDRILCQQWRLTLEDFVWYTADEMCEEGFWEGTDRYVLDKEMRRDDGKYRRKIEVNLQRVRARRAA